MARSRQIAEIVNQAAANDANFKRLPKRRAIDAFMGVLAEAGWLQFINSRFGPIASSTAFADITAQIDIELSNGERVEVRSSHIKNGLNFGLCNIEYNFKNIGPYSNTVKPGEIQKDFYLGSLFEVEKQRLLVMDDIEFYLVGGSTWGMMESKGYDDPLTPREAIVPIPSVYKVIRLKDALDAEGVIDEIAKLGYVRI